MNYSAISIQGNIFTSEILEKIRQEDTRFQAAKDFNLNQGDSVRDEINLAWSLAISHWNAFKQKREALSLTDTGTTETRRYWMLPLLQILGYDVSQSNAEIINEKSYAVSHRVSNKDGFPIHIVGIQQSLDKKADIGGARLSPHALIQEYLNNTEHLYGFTTNGAMFRVLRDATRLSRLSYIEFNLEQMMEEGLYVEFALLYRTLHGSRIANKKEENAESIIEWYHQEALSSGSRIRERLSQAVEQSILLLANGILDNPNNIALRQEIDDDKITPHQYYLYVLRTVYRILFLLVIEERKLIYPEKRDDELNRKRNVYYKFYSIQRLTYLVEKKVYIDPRKTDLWQSLLTTFHLFEISDQGAKIGISALGSGLFAPNALGGLQDQLVNNETLLKVLRYLVTFENENKQLVRVNYADLDVEEFGSVYEGLLEYAPAFNENHNFLFKKGTERSSSGAHYTPEELVKPLIVHSLDYLIADKLKELDPEVGLLSLSICDVACGSGHILLSAARRVGFELAKYRSKEDQPTPSVLRIAIRDVIKNCIYGVDLNPLAVELCKVALWLEAHEPGQPMNFLDHHIKCGNAIVGLAHFEELENSIASEAFKTLPGDDKEIATAFRNRNNLERKTKDQLSTYEIDKVDEDYKGLQNEFISFTKLPENTPEQITKKDKAYKDLTNGKKWFRLKKLADIQVAQFFIPKTLGNKEKLTTHSQYVSYLKTEAQIIDQGASMSISAQKRFFHWFLEFPQVFQNGGFDCILGNPPFLGDRKLKDAYGEQFLEWIRTTYTNGATIDLIGYFFLRIDDLVKKNGFLSLISTTTICQGKAREESLDKILQFGHTINHAIKTMPWPGDASVDVSLITIHKGEWNKVKTLNLQNVDFISSFLDNQNTSSVIYKLIPNSNKSFQGNILVGKGFLLEENLAKKLLDKNSENSKVLFPFLNGVEITHHPKHMPKNWVISFFDMSKEEAEKYVDVFEILEKTVKSDRQRWALDKNGVEIIGKYALRSPLPQKWWQHCEKRPMLYSKILDKQRVLVIVRISKFLISTFVPNNWIYSDKCIVVTEDSMLSFAQINSSIFEIWTWKYTSTIRSSGLIFTPGNIFETFPFLLRLSESDKVQLSDLANVFFQYRNEILINQNIGLLHLYNQYHSQLIGNIEFYEQIIQLRKLQEKMDNLVLYLYGWNDIDLAHGFYEIDYMSENDRVRYTIHPEARKEVLKRLLELNHKIHEEEVAAGLWDKKKAVKKKIIDEKAKVQKQETNQVSIFDISKDTIMKEFKNTDGIYTITDVARIINKPTDRVRRWFNKLAEIDYEGLDGSTKIDIDKRQISFLGLVELVVIGELIENNFKIRAIFKARHDLANKTGKTFPFATNNVNQKLKVSGSDITWDFEDGNVTLNGKNQFNLEIIREFFDDIEFDTSGIAQRITPSKGLKLIEITPTVGGGKPSIISQKGVNVETILRFYNGPESIDEIIADYEISKDDIEAVLAYQS